MFIILLLRRLSARSRLIVGLVLACAGVTLIAVAIVAAPGLLIHGVITVVLGVVFLGSAMVSRRRARLAAQTDAGGNGNLSAHLVRRGGK